MEFFLGAKLSFAYSRCIRKLICYTIHCCLVFGLGQVLAQAPISVPNSEESNDTSKILLVNRDGLDTLIPRNFPPLDSQLATNARDSIGQDTFGPKKIYLVSPDALTDAVQYKMRDSMHYSIGEKIIRLYRDAEVQYTDITLAAGYMEIDYGKKVVVAEPRIDSVGKKAGLPSFAQGAQAFTAQGLRYNFDTRKGIIYDAVTKQGDLFVLGSKTKIVAADPRDPRRADNTVFNQDAIITTCELDHPHYGIRSSKQKIIPGKQVIVGPSNVELGGVPTPLWLPFGFFPIGSSERSGLIFPSDYTYTNIDGFGFQGVGWYFPWNDKIHSSVTADIFLKRTLRFDVSSQYNVRYKYAGSLLINVSRNRTEFEGVEDFAQSFRIDWSHRQDPKAHPYRTFSASTNFQSNLNSRRNNASPYAQTSNIANSNINYTIKFPEHPSWNLSAGLQHSQNFQTRAVKLRFPDVQFRTGQMYPFANAKGNSRSWYRKATIEYDAALLGDVQSTDTTLFTQKTLDDATFGARHRVRASAPVNVLKHFRLSPSVEYSEFYYLDQRLRSFEIDTTVRLDSTVVAGATIFTRDTSFQSRLRDTLISADGFADAARSISASLSLSTQVYGTARFRIGAMRGLRHIITPSVSAGYQPNYASSPFNYFNDLVDPLTGISTQYLRFPNQPFSPGSLSPVRNLNLSYSINNRLEAKLQGRDDSTSRIVAILNALSFGGSYAPGLDSLKWSPIRVSGAQANFFQNIIRINFGTTLSIYEVNEAREAINSTLISAGKFPLRIDNFSYTISAGLTLEQARLLLMGKNSQLPNNSIFGLVNKFNISYNFGRNYNSRSVVEPWRTSANTINVSGPLPITDKWSIRNITIGYDLIQHRLTYPTLSIGRDLHCWEMDFFWSPAFNGQFTFSIRVKPSSLGFLSIPYRRGSSR